MELSTIINAMNTAPSGSFIGITDYVSSDMEVSSITGQIGVSYSNAKEKSVAKLEKAIETGDFKPIRVQGVCNQCPATGVYNSRQKSWPMVDFDITFTKAQVLQAASEVLESYRNANRKTNKTQLSVKENAVYLENETGNINITILVQNQTYKENKSKALKANAGHVDKIKASMPHTLLKEQIRKRFAPSFKSFTLRDGNFKSLTIGGSKFE